MIHDLRFKKLFLVFVILATSTLLLFHSFTLTTAEPNCDAPGPGDIDFCLEKIQAQIDALSPAQEYNKKELADLRQQIENLESRISAIFFQLDQVSQNIRGREEDLAYTQAIYEEKTNNHYKFIRLYNPILPFLSSQDASKAFREINFRAKAANEDVKTIETYATDLLGLKNDKQNLEDNQASLASLRNQVENRAEFLSGEVEKTESYLASLSARQEELLALKAGGFQTSVGDTPPPLSSRVRGHPAHPIFATQDLGRPMLRFLLAHPTEQE